MTMTAQSTATFQGREWAVTWDAEAGHYVLTGKRGRIYWLRRNMTRPRCFFVMDPQSRSLLSGQLIHSGNHFEELP